MIAGSPARVLTSSTTEVTTRMIIGAHSLIYSTDPAADRAFFRDVLGLNHIDVGDGWLIFGLPTAEVAVHPSEQNDVHEFYLMCDDVKDLVSTMRRQKIACSPIRNQVWGLITEVTLPGGGRLGIYQPRHARPKPTRIVQLKKRKIGRE